MWQWILSFLTAPVLNSLVQAYQLKLTALNSTEAHAVDLAVADFQAEIEARKIAASVQSTSWGGIIDAAFAIPIIIYMAKVFLWDAAFGWGTSDAVKGDVSIWAGMVVGFYFGGRIATNIISEILSVFRK